MYIIGLSNEDIKSSEKTKFTKSFFLRARYKLNNNNIMVTLVIIGKTSKSGNAECLLLKIKTVRRKKQIIVHNG
jgi:hypothetical protein